MAHSQVPEISDFSQLPLFSVPPWLAELYASLKDGDLVARATAVGSIPRLCYINVHQASGLQDICERYLQSPAGIAKTWVESLTDGQVDGLMTGLDMLCAELPPRFQAFEDILCESTSDTPEAEVEIARRGFELIMARDDIQSLAYVLRFRCGSSEVDAALSRLDTELCEYHSLWTFVPAINHPRIHTVFLREVDCWWGLLSSWVQSPPSRKEHPFTAPQP